MTSIFNQTSSLFNNPPPSSNTTNQQSQGKKDLFGSINLNVNTSQPQQSGSLFGSAPATQTGGLFGSSQPATTGGLLSTSQPQQSGSIFGNTTQQKPGGLFGSTAQQPQSNNVFGQPQTQQQNTQQSGGLFGNLGSTNQQSQQQPAGNSIFGNFGQSSQPQQQQQPTQQQQPSVLGQSLGTSRLFQNSEIAPRQKSVTDQIDLAFTKWNENSSSSPFQTYLYNSVPPSDAPFYGPGPGEDEQKWEEALAKKPSAGSIPVVVRGFQSLAWRMQQQYHNLSILRGRLREINDGLTTLLNKHETETAVRAEACRRRHLVLSRQCLRLAAKTQVLRNRGYVMDAAEEELRKKLLSLERDVLDPELIGRSEEIWARMMGVRDRGKLLRQELERAGRDVDGNGAGEIDEDVMKRAKKILEDYSSQLAHLGKELEAIQKDWKDFENSRPLGAKSGR